jgi:hypothetical protein
MLEHNSVYIAVNPPVGLDTALVSGLATAINKTPYQARLLLAGDVPKIAARCDTMQAAESLIRSLQHLGLAAIACEESNLRRLTQTFKAETVEFREKEVLFRDGANREKKVVRENVFLLLAGRVESFLEAETTKRKIKFSPGRTLLAGGIPIWRTVDEKTRTHSAQAESFVRLYELHSAEPGVDIFQKHMNYSFLGADLAVSSLANFAALVQRFRQVFPLAIFDDRLAKASALTISSRRSWDDIEITCKLIYLFHAMSQGPGYGA